MNDYFKKRIFRYCWLAVLIGITGIACNGIMSSESIVSIVGTWVLKESSDDVTILTRSDRLDENQYGFTFRSAGVFIERKNAGWCGTPPVHYQNFAGHWKKLSDNLYNINAGYWDGQTSFRIEVLTLSTCTLHIRYHYSD